MGRPRGSKNKYKRGLTPKEVRKCIGGCGLSKEVKVTSTWKICKPCSSRINGRKSAAYICGKIWMCNKLNQEMYVDIKDRLLYLQNGWVNGRSEISKHAMIENQPDRHYSGMFNKKVSEDTRRKMSLSTGGTGIFIIHYGE